MKNNILKSLFISVILLAGTSNVWAWDIHGNLYFNNSSKKWTNVSLIVGNDSWHQGYKFSKLNNTQLYYSWVDYSGYNDLYFVNANYTSNGNSKPYDKAKNYTRWQPGKFDYKESKQWYFDAITQDKTLILPKYTATADIKVSKDGGNTYTVTHDITLGVLTLTGTYMNGNAATGQSTETTDGTRKYNYENIPVTGEFTLTNTSVTNEAYEFVGFGTGDKPTINSNSHTWNVTASTTYYAFYKAKSYTVTLDPQNGASTSTVTAIYGSAMPTITPPTRTGYTFNGYYDATSSGTQYYKADGSSARTWNKTSNTTLYAQWTINSHDVTWKANGGNWSGSTADKVVTYNYGATIAEQAAPTRVGYEFAGWSPAFVANTTMPDNALTYTAQWTANQYTITLDKQGGTGGTSEVAVHYDNNDYSVNPVSVPSIQGYAFMGYYVAENGSDFQVVDATGNWVKSAPGYTDDSGNWKKASDITLYAFFKKAEITSITLNQGVFEPGTGEVTATATIDPTPAGTTIICWQLLYSNGNAVPNYETQSGNSATFSIAGLVAGTYKIEATLRTGNDCGSGEPLSTLTKNFIIASEYTVTVKYTCDNQEIKASTTAPAHATKPETLIATDIFGYAFSAWEAGDGVEIKTTSADKKTITYTAIYNGTITAKYTKKKLIYFKRPADWGTTIYYYNIGSADKWKESGDGNWGLYTNDINYGAIQMTRIGDSDVYYYDYEATPNTNDDPGLYIAFADAEQNGYTPMWHGCHVSWPIKNTRSFNEGTPMFVAANYRHHQWGANYYNAGYWTNYVGETGYTLKIYDKKEGGRKELYSIPFEAATTDNNIPFKAVVDLEAEKTYGFKFVRANGIWYKNDKDGTMTNSSHTDWPFIWDNEDGSACGITTTAAGEYTFTLNLNNATGNLQISVDYPAAVGDYRVLYTDTAATNWSGNTRPQNWCHPSRIIKKKDGANDTISFFINKDKEPQLLYQTINSINASTGAITWNAAKEFEDVKWNVIEKDGVINFTFTQSKGAIAVTNIELYKGNYYIRVDAVDGKWGNYKTDPDNRMTYSAFSEKRETNTFGELFSHYKTKWCPRETNVKFTIANDYSPCITDTLIRDITKTWEENMDDGGKLYTDNSQDPTADKYSANIRFMWDRNTNKISRAYLSSATNVTKKFLILQGDEKMADSDGNAIAATTYVPANATLLQDKENWIYETTIKVQPGARVKLYACYTKTEVEEAQYFRGTNAAFSESSTVQILGGTGETWYTMRVIYDFKTNRLMGAWVPSGDITGEVAINADVMIMREHQEDATCITLSNDDSKLTLVKTVYGAIRFNRWTLNNRDTESHEPLPLVDQKSIYERGLYFISFPFDVHLSNAFGLGTYGTHWVISEYNGLRRAQRGYFEEDCINEDCTNWDYIWEPDTFVMKANVGYLLSLDLDLMKHDNTSFWAHDIQQVELFFPSYANVETIAQTSYTMPALGDEYLCKINYSTDNNDSDRDRTVKDSYWRCIGVPSFANYAGLLQQGDEKQNITWQPDGDNFPFLYEWNTTDNSLMVQSTNNYNFRSTFAYLVQNGNKIYWSAVNTKPSSIVARQRTEAQANYAWKIAVMRNDQVEDQTFVRMVNSEEVTTNFDFGQDLSKEFNYGRADIYTLIGYERVAANSLPLSEQTTVIPLGLDIEQAGDYTIAMPEGVENIGITLVDNETGIHTNLSAGQEYTLTLNNGICENRLFIEVSPIQNTPTDLEYTTEDTREQTTRKVLINEKLYIIRDGVVYDAQGHRL